MEKGFIWAQSSRGTQSIMSMKAWQQAGSIVAGLGSSLVTLYPQSGSQERTEVRPGNSLKALVIYFTS